MKELHAEHANELMQVINNGDTRRQLFQAPTLLVLCMDDRLIQFQNFVNLMDEKKERKRVVKVAEKSKNLGAVNFWSNS